MAERKTVARSGAKTAVWREAANGRRLLRSFILAVLCCMILPLPAAAQWAAADLFPNPPVPAAAGPHGNSALEGMVDISPVVRGLGRLRLQLPGGSTVEMARDGFERRGDGDITWRGKVNGDEGSQVILTVKDGYMAGTILDGLDEYQIRPGPGRSHIIERVDAGEQPADEQIAPPIDYSYDVEPVYNPSPFPPDPYGNSPDNIQLLVVYTAPARVAAGGEPQIEVLIQSMVDQANAAFANSGMIARLSLVRTEEIPYSESSDVTIDLNYIVNDADAFLLRHEYAADLVSLVVDNGGACASAAYIMNQVGPDFAPYGFSVVSLNCGAGTLAHEVGHNLGFEHNPEDSIRYEPGGSYNSADPYSFGHYVDGSFRTIMSYATPCALGCPKALHFSNPAIDFLGSPTGIVDERDNALTGFYSAPVVADFFNERTGALVNRRIAATADDVEELAAGTVVFDSTTLELGDGLTGTDAVGLRFQNIHIPPGAIVDSAFLEFEAAETGSDPASLQISAEAADDALPFSATAFDVTGRAATAEWVQWDLPPWDTLTEKHYSPDLSAVIQEVVDRPGWAENNSMVLLLNGTGLRTALSYDGDPAGAPLLHVEYSIIHPKAAYSYQCTGLTCSFTDESEGDITLWDWYFYDSSSWWFNSPDQNVTVTFPADGTYTLQFAVGNDKEHDILTEQITVSSGNTPPVASDDAYVTAADTPVSGNVLTDGTPDSDVNGDALTVTANSSPPNGTVTVAASGDFTYMPAAGYIGTDSFTYTVNDGNGGSDTGTVTITVTNTAPVATDDNYATLEDTAVSGNVLADGTPDSDPDGDSLTVTANTSPLNGVATVAANGDFTYTPDADFNGSDSFTYTISDGNGGSATATVTLTVNPVNDPPLANDDSYVTDEDVVLTGNVLTDGTPDSDVDGDVLTVTSNTSPANGTLTVAADGAFTYTPSVEFSGSDGFAYTISDGNGGTATATVGITVNFVNDPPVATDNAYTTDEDTPITANLLTDGVPDSDVEGDALRVADVTTPATYGGTWVRLDTGIFTYTPIPEFSGTDSFQYTVTDGEGVSAPATVTITVNPVNDLPVANFSQSCGNLACDFTDGSTDIDGTIASWSWSFGDGAVSTAQNPSHTYAAGGTYTVVLVVDDDGGATATFSQTITMTAENTFPIATDNAYSTAEDVAVSGNLMSDGVPDSDSDGDVLTVVSNTNPPAGTAIVSPNGTFTYTPNANFNGTDSFDYTVGDGKGGSDTATVTITIDAVNDAPVATDNHYTTDEDTTVSGNLLTDGVPDSDPEGDFFTVTDYTEPSSGSAYVSQDGNFTYWPWANTNGTDSFTYTVTQWYGGSSTATVTITVNPVNDPPQAAAKRYTTSEDTAISGDVLLIESDIDGDPLSVTAHTDPANGALTMAADGIFTYSPATDFNGTDGFDYTISDGKGGVDTATVTITVNAVNDAPVAAFSYDCAGLNCYFTNESTDVDGGISSSSWSFGDGGVSTFYTVPHVYTADGSYTVVLTVSDNDGAVDTVTQTIAVANTAPVATDDSYLVAEDSSVGGNVLTDGTPDSDPDGDAVAVTGHSGAASGTVTVSADGTFSYVPNADFNGTDSFSYSIGDGNGGAATATVTITVLPMNDAPVATDNVYATDEDVAVSGNVLTDATPDSDADGDPLNIIDRVEPLHGKLLLNNADGAFTYTPNADFNGSDSFTYTITDGRGKTDTGTVTITINPVNDIPVASDDAYATDEDVAVSGNVLTDGTPDSDADGDTVTVTGNTAPANGTVTVATNGDFTYTPNLDFNGADSFTYTIADGAGGSDAATVSIIVNPVNDPPVASDDSYSTDEDVAVAGNFLTDGTPDSDVDGDPLTVTGNTGPANGMVLVAANGAFTYTPGPDFNGNDSFTYTVDDGAGGSDTATVTITVNLVNDAPVASDDAYATDEDVALSGNVLTDGTPDSDVDGDALTVTGNTSPANGTASVAANGDFTYTPSPDFYGSDSFTYTVDDGAGGSDTATVSITVNPVNDIPVVNDDAYATDEDVALSGNVLTDGTPDSDADGDTLTVTGNTNPANGTVSMAANGSFSYTPDTDFNGSDSFTYAVDDGAGGSDTATVRITVNPVNDAPVASDDAYATDEDVAVSGNVLTDGTPDSDVDSDTLTVTGNAAPANGTVSMAANGVFTYTPGPDFSGADSFTYTVGDGAGGSDTATVSITVNPVNDLPVASDDVYATDEDVAVSGNVLTDGTPDSDADGDALTVTGNTGPANGMVSVAANGAFTYTPGPDFNGNDSFTYTVDDGAGGSDTATVSITVNSVNDPPVASDDSYSTDEDVAVAGNFLTDGTPDSDVDGDALTVTGNTAPTNGTLTMAADGSFTYTPAPDFNGADSFTYTMGDGAGGSDTATVSLAVKPVNDAPVATANAYTTPKNKAISGNVLTDGTPDSDVDGDALTAELDTAPSNGTASLALDGTFTYTPTPGFSGNDSFTYLVKDGNGGTDVATVDVTVEGNCPAGRCAVQASSIQRLDLRANR